jgi:hypothetical protein
MTSRERWDVANPRKTLREVVDRARPVDGDVVVVTMAARTGGATQILDVTTVHTAGAPLERHEASELLRRYAVATVPELPPARAGARADHEGRPRGLDYVVVTVVCRGGRVVPGPTEMFWALAWRYANHLANAFDGDVYTVTPHGWTGLSDERAGFTPALASPMARALAAALPS